MSKCKHCGEEMLPNTSYRSAHPACVDPYTVELEQQLRDYRKLAVSHAAHRKVKQQLAEFRKAVREALEGRFDSAVGGGIEVFAVCNKEDVDRLAALLQGEGE